MGEILNDLSSQALNTAIKANLFAYYDHLGRSPTVEFREDACFKWVLTGLPVSFLNNILYTRLNSGDIDEIIAEVLAGLRAKGITRLSWWSEPGTQPADLGEFLRRQGLIYDNEEPGMSLDLQELQEAPLPEGFTVQRVEDLPNLEEFIHAAAGGFGFPADTERQCVEMFASLGFDQPLRHYIGILDGKTVATSQMFLGAGVAGLYWVSTLPEARRRGMGAAITRTPLLQARALGYRIGILHASDMGFPVYRQLGFKEQCRMGHYVWTGGIENR
jgi:GNAT superfamily N-acetyltransferase